LDTESKYVIFFKKKEIKAIKIAANSMLAEDFEQFTKDRLGEKLRLF